MNVLKTAFLTNYPTLQEVRNHLQKQGVRPLRRDEIPDEQRYPLLVCLGGEEPIFALNGQPAGPWGWQQKVAGYWMYPVAEARTA